MVSNCLKWVERIHRNAIESFENCTIACEKYNAHLPGADYEEIDFLKIERVSAFNNSITSHLFRPDEELR